MTSRFTGLNAGYARSALAGAATAVVAVVCVALLLADVPRAEVAATALFLPVFVAGLLAGRGAGYGAAALATVAYVALRRDDLAAAAAAKAGVVTLTRAGAYVIAAHVGALAQSLTPDGRRDATPARQPSAPARRRAGAAAAPYAEPSGWEQVWEAPERAPAGVYDRAQPVLAGVGSTGAGGYPYPGDEGGNGVYPDTTMSGAWPPEPPGDPWVDQPARPPDRGRGAGYDEPAPAADDSWSAVQQSWRQQHGLPPEDDQAGFPLADDDPRGWYDQPPGRPGDPRQDTTAGAWGPPPATDQWGSPAQQQADQWGPQSAPGEWGGAPPDAWAAPAPAEHWDDGAAGLAPPAPAGHDATPWPAVPADDQWGDAAPTGGTWPTDPGSGNGWSPGPPGGGERWSSGPAGGEGGWSPGPPGGDERWSSGPEAGGGGWAPDVPNADAGWGGQAPTQAGWAAAPGGESAWAPGPTGGESGWAPDAPAADAGWGGPPPAEAAWAPAPAPADDPWTSPPPADGGWSPGAQDQAYAEQGDSWGPPPAPSRWDDAPAEQGWGGLAGDAWPASSPQGPPAWDPSMPDPGQPSGPPPAPLPAVDPETGLWTAKFLRDRLTSERARSRRTGHPFSLVLVQVPDGPLAQLPYRRQVTLLRELGYQFVAGGVVDHLVHVPDQSQHWFAVILPDTDRSGAQVLERRLRLGIGGYLSSRGLRLRELESASLTAPDDDPAMGAIWDALIGSEDDE